MDFKIEMSGKFYFIRDSFCEAIQKRGRDLKDKWCWSKNSIFTYQTRKSRIEREACKKSSFNSCTLILIIHFLLFLIIGAEPATFGCEDIAYQRLKFHRLRYWWSNFWDFLSYIPQRCVSCANRWNKMSSGMWTPLAAPWHAAQTCHQRDRSALRLWPIREEFCDAPANQVRRNAGGLGLVGWHRRTSGSGRRYIFSVSGGVYIHPVASLRAKRNARFFFY